MLYSEFTFSEEFLHEAVVQHSRITVARKLMTAVKALCFLCLLAISALLFFVMKQIGIGFLFIGFAVLLLFSRSLDRYILGWRFRKSPYWNRRIRMELAEEGVRTSLDLGSSIVRWSAFTRVVGLKHGFLLYQGPHVFNWLPLSTFEGGATRDSIATFLKARTMKYEERT